MKTLAPSLPPIREDAVDEIPVLDLGRLRAGTPGAKRRTRRRLRHVFEHVGFYYVVNHGVPQTLIDDAFAAARRFHAQPLDKKLEIHLNEFNIGYLPMRGGTTRHSTLNANNKPNVNEAFFCARDLAPDHPDVVAGKPYRCANKWPADLPGFRETCLAYTSALETLARSLVPLYALALDLPETHFDEAFAKPMFKLRMTHYPPQDPAADNEFGLGAAYRHQLHDAARAQQGRGPVHPLAERTLDRCAGDRRGLSRQRRRHAAALDQRSLPRHAASRAQSLRRRALRHSLLFRLLGRAPDGVSADLHQSG